MSESSEYDYDPLDSEITFEQACDIKLYIGQYRGQTIFDIGSSDEGLKWLDWLVGQDWFKKFSQYKFLKVYLSDKFISQHLSLLLED